MSDHVEDVLSTAAGWRATGEQVALATVTETWGSSPRPAGSQMAVTKSGRMAGSVSGGCVEGAVVEAALELLRGERDRGVITFGYSDDDAFAVGLTCGGTIHLFVEPLDW